MTDRVWIVYNEPEMYEPGPVWLIAAFTSKEAAEGKAAENPDWSVYSEPLTLDADACVL